MTEYDEILASMRERYKALAGFAPDDASDIGIRLRVLAEQVTLARERAGALEKQVFPQTSGGEYLDMHAATRGLSRKEAIPASGMLRFSREIAAASDIKIEKGIICATRGEPQIRYETIEEVILPAGQTKADVPAIAMLPGKTGNAAAGAICLMVTAAAGISSVGNPAAFGGGVDGESDSELRARLMESYRYISNGTNRAFYYDLAMACGGVVSANIIPRKRGRGTVDVIVALAPGAQAAAILPGLREELENKKEVNVDILVEEAQVKSTGVTLQIQADDISLYDITEANCKSAVTGYLSGLAVGEPLLLARLSGVAMSVPGVYNCKISGADVIPLANQVIRPGTVTIQRIVS